VDAIDSELGRAVRARLESEVPLGAFLSGGIDSGLIVSYMAEALGDRLVTASVGFDQAAHNELDAARLTATHCHARHYEETIQPRLDEVLTAATTGSGEPLADSSTIPTWYVSRSARAHVTVALSGDGGDETFAGYDFRYVPHVIEERARRLALGAPGRRLAGWLGDAWPRSPRLPRPLRLGSLLRNMARDPASAYYMDLCFLKPDKARRLLGRPAIEDPSLSPVYAAVTDAYRRCTSQHALTRAQYADLHVYMPNDPLVKVDRMSMAHSLEVRCPLLDRRVVEMAFRIPAPKRQRGTTGKWLLRKLAERRLPAELSRHAEARVHGAGGRMAARRRRVLFPRRSPRRGLAGQRPSRSVSGARLVRRASCGPGESQLRVVGGLGPGALAFDCELLPHQGAFYLPLRCLFRLTPRFPLETARSGVQDFCFAPRRPTLTELPSQSSDASIAPGKPAKGASLPMMHLRMLRSLSRGVWTSLALLVLHLQLVVQFFWTRTSALKRAGRRLDATQRQPAYRREPERNAVDDEHRHRCAVRKLFSYVLDADVYAQPLVIPNVAIAGKGTHNVVYVVTMNNSVYALDADDNKGNNGAPLWSVNLNNRPTGNPGAGGRSRSRGQHSKPRSGRRNGNAGHRPSDVDDVLRRPDERVKRLRAEAARPGHQERAEKFGGPVTIQASVPGTNTYDSVGGVVTFNTRRQNQRAALALGSGSSTSCGRRLKTVIPITPGSWPTTRRRSTRSRSGARRPTVLGRASGCRARAPRSTRSEASTPSRGNGTFTADTGGKDYGEALVKLSPMLGTVLDWFAPNNWSFLNGGDLDFGSAGALLIPDTNLVLGGGKFGRFYLLDRSNLGHVQPADTQNRPELPGDQRRAHPRQPCLLERSRRPLVYVMGEEDFLKGFRFNGAQFDPTPATMTTFPASQGMPGGFLSVSANGSTAGSGIVWVNMPSAADAEVPGRARNTARFQRVGPFAGAVEQQSERRKRFRREFREVRRADGGQRPRLSPDVLGEAERLRPAQLLYTSIGRVTDSDERAVIGDRGSDGRRHLGLGAMAGIPAKGVGASQISDVTVAGGTPATYATDARTLTWSDGITPVSGSTQSGIQIPSIGSGFTLSAPADTTARTLTLYVRGANSTGPAHRAPVGWLSAESLRQRRNPVPPCLRRRADHFLPRQQRGHGCTCSGRKWRAQGM
jgi:hypothetical protein